MAKGAKVLVVDDEVVFSELMSLTFKDAGFQVECASAGRKAIEEGKNSNQIFSFVTGSFGMEQLDSM
jgi:DNA-binding response OmpR family regulator